MKQNVKTRWRGEMQFEADVDGHTILMDSPGQFGGKDKGPSPKPLILAALSGCTGMDVIALLKHEGIILDELVVDVEAETDRTMPDRYSSAVIVYEAEGKDDFRSNVYRAVSRSQHELCGVGKMLGKAIKITWRLRYNGKEVTETSIHR